MHHVAQFFNLHIIQMSLIQGFGIDTMKVFTSLLRLAQSTLLT